MLLIVILILIVLGVIWVLFKRARRPKRYPLFDIEEAKKMPLEDVEREFNIPRWMPFRGERWGRSKSGYYRFLGEKKERELQKRGMKALGIDKEYEWE